ncbi:MAG: alpha/beta hydrolase family esterase [Silvanigrellaceae bacterium]
MNGPSILLNFFVAVCAIISACVHKRSRQNQSGQPTVSSIGPIRTFQGDCQNSTTEIIQPGFWDGCLLLNGDERKFRVYRPQGHAPNSSPIALVIVLHGGGGSAEAASDPSQNALGVMNSIADKAGFVVVYPQGTADSGGRLGWNDCRSDDRSKSGADDVGFLAALILKLQHDLKIDRTKVFMTGTSNGAMMTFRFAMEKPEMLGGIATSSGNIAKNPMDGRCKSGSPIPVPILMTHGSEDPVVPANGGVVACLGRTRNSCHRGEVLSSKATVEFWLKTNHLENSYPKTRTLDEVENDGGSAIESVYEKVKIKQSEVSVSERPLKVVSWTLNGAGHPPPSRVVDKGNRFVGTQNREIEFAEIAWNFFRSI